MLYVPCTVLAVLSEPLISSSQLFMRERKGKQLCPGPRCRNFEFVVSKLMQWQQDKFMKETWGREEGNTLNRSEQESKEGQMEIEATVDKDTERNKKKYSNDGTWEKEKSDRSSAKDSLNSLCKCLGVGRTAWHGGGWDWLLVIWEQKSCVISYSIKSLLGCGEEGWGEKAHNCNWITIKN